MDSIDVLVSTSVDPIQKVLNNKWLLSLAFLVFALTLTQLILVSLLQADVRDSTNTTTSTTQRLSLALQVISFLVFFMIFQVVFNAALSGGPMSGTPQTLLAAWIILLLFVVACSSMCTTSLPDKGQPVGTRATTNTSINLALLIIQFLVVLQLGVSQRKVMAEVFAMMPVTSGIAGGSHSKQMPNYWHN